MYASLLSMQSLRGSSRADGSGEGPLNLFDELVRHFAYVMNFSVTTFRTHSPQPTASARNGTGEGMIQAKICVDGDRSHTLTHTHTARR